MTVDEQLREMVKACGLPVRGSYRNAEVCMILGFSRATFCRLIDAWQPDDNGNPVVSLFPEILHAPAGTPGKLGRAGGLPGAQRHMGAPLRDAGRGGN